MVPINQTKLENLKKVPRTDCPHLPSPPSVRNTFFDFPLHTPYFGTPLIGPKLVGFLVGRTIGVKFARRSEYPDPDPDPDPDPNTENKSKYYVNVLDVDNKSHLHKIQY